MKVTLLAALLSQLALFASASPMPDAEPEAGAAAVAVDPPPWDPIPSHTPPQVVTCLLACFPVDDPDFRCPPDYVRRLLFRPLIPRSLPKLRMRRSNHNS